MTMSMYDDSQKQLVKTAVVVENRPALIWNFSETAPNVPTQAQSLAAIPQKSQEKIILKELINCLVGVSGQFIVGTKKDGVVEFKISDQISESIRMVVGQILPLAKHFCAVQHFIHEQARKESGQVLRAVGAAMNDFLNEYFLSISALEADDLKNRLTLQKLLFLIQPKMNGMMVLEEVARKLTTNDVSGGKALCLLHKTILTMAGDSGESLWKSSSFFIFDHLFPSSFSSHSHNHHPKGFGSLYGDPPQVDPPGHDHRSLPRVSHPGQ